MVSSPVEILCIKTLLHRATKLLPAEVMLISLCSQGRNALRDLSSEMFRGTKALEVRTSGWLSKGISVSRLGFLFHQELDLSQNVIRYIPREMMNEFQNLKVLSLHRNWIIDVPGNTFQNLTLLEKLVLSGNGLKYLSADSFKGLEVLTNLDLSNNGLEYIPEGLLEPLKELEVLNIRYVLPSKVLCIPILLFILFSFNRIKSMPASLMKNLKSLRRLDIRRTLITFVVSP